MHINGRVAALEDDEFAVLVVYLLQPERVLVKLPRDVQFLTAMFATASVLPSICASLVLPG